MTQPCPTCDATLADNAKTCPNCGHVLKQDLVDEIFNPAPGPVLGGVAIFLVLMVLFIGMGLLVS